MAQATSFSADSPAGRRVLQKALRVRNPPRALQDNNDYDQEQQQWAEYNEDYLADLTSMSIKYVGCSSFTETDDYDWEAEYQQQEEEQQQAEEGEDGQDVEGEEQDMQQRAAYNWWQYQRLSRNDGMQATNMVRFTLCPDNACGSCSGEYVIDMEYFLEAYTEWQMDHDTYYCEKTREQCQCQNGSNWYSCYKSCFEYYGQDYDHCLSAMKDDGEDNVFEIQQYLECSGVAFYNPQYQYNSGSYTSARKLYYLGLTCENYADVKLTAFYDQQCTYRTTSADMSAMTSAMEKTYHKMPYIDGTPILTAGTCITCMAPEDEVEQSIYVNKYANGNYQQAEDAEQEEEEDAQPDATDLCMMITGVDEDKAIVCDQYNRNGCTYIEDYMPKMDGRNPWTQAVASVRNQLSKSKRLSYALAAVVAVLVAILAYFIGFYCCVTSRRTIESPENPKMEKSLLDYRASSDGGSVSSDDEPKTVTPPVLA
eukprot:CAMPEP_0172440712 /NCGR_PEP_ID=MMETSP1065-20121228/1332_1 /TAXON_ID=265537 /ORGANISM="Amphiprora paludosa, Strain CCMP125" /LENGTH=480 /DNA_ID=CAMNT_0013189691 /DNA_START=71 /DNA_END=1513 /DNA_ORIENTATION=-